MALRCAGDLLADSIRFPKCFQLDPIRDVQVLIPSGALDARALNSVLQRALTCVAKDHHPEVRVLTTDPLNGIGERQFEATDALVRVGLVYVVGVY